MAFSVARSPVICLLELLICFILQEEQPVVPKIITEKAVEVVTMRNTLFKGGGRKRMEA